MKTIAPVHSTQKPIEKPSDSSTKKITVTKIEPLQLNIGNDQQQQQQQSYRANDARRDEAVNTIDSTFRR
jgi:hypothetical protein